MADDLTPDDVRSRRFEVALRGYDRGAVDAFRDEVASLVEELQARVTTLEGRLEAGGIAGARGLKEEFDAVAEEVGAILHSAREAAAQMRTRAAADAARWRAEADTESREARATAIADAEHARGDAWETGTELLRQAADEADAILRSAEQDALFIRAEAEREALRLTGDARRDREEEVRAARTQAERMLIDARAESEAILETARQSAEAAQERARALEMRRAELMDELEAARRSIGQLEQEIDTRREALHYHGAAEPSGMRVIAPGTGDEEYGDSGGDWLDEDMAVRVVPAVSVPEPEPVDADAFIAEVMEMRSRVEAVAEVEPELPPSVARDDGEEASPAPDDVAPVAEPVADEAVPEEEPLPPPPPEPATPEPAPAVVETSAPPAAAAAPPPDDLADLFAELRSTPPPRPPVEETPAGAQPPESDEAGDARQPQAPPDAEVARPVEAREAGGIDPFELRDRLLIPIENRALRSVKRRLVDLQNRVLEEVRVAGDDWVPDPTMPVAAFDDDVDRLAQEAVVAGYAGATDLAGADRTPQPSGSRIANPTGEVVTALAAAIDEAARRARDAGAGSRQLSAAISRVFRAWRTDEAERRLRRLCYVSYHDGLIRAFPEVGVSSVIGVAPGQPCGQCPAGTGVAWAPGSELPDGRSMPPASESCRCTIVPAEA